MIFICIYKTKLPNFIQKSETIESLTFQSEFGINRIFSGELGSMYALETCSNKMNITFKTGNDPTSKGGVSIYFEGFFLNKL